MPTLRKKPKGGVLSPGVHRQMSWCGPPTAPYYHTTNMTSPPVRTKSHTLPVMTSRGPMSQHVTGAVVMSSAQTWPIPPQKTDHLMTSPPLRGPTLDTAVTSPSHIRPISVHVTDGTVTSSPKIRPTSQHVTDTAMTSPHPIRPTLPYYHTLNVTSPPLRTKSHTLPVMTSLHQVGPMSQHVTGTRRTSQDMTDMSVTSSAQEGSVVTSSPWTRPMSQHMTDAVVTSLPPTNPTSRHVTSLPPTSPTSRHMTDAVVTSRSQSLRVTGSELRLSGNWKRICSYTLEGKKNRAGSRYLRGKKKAGTLL